MTPTSSGEAHFEHAKKKTDKLTTLVKASKVRHNKARILHQMMHRPSLTFGLCSVALTPSQIDKIKKPAVAAHMSAMGFNRNMPTEVWHGSYEVGGIRMLNLHMVHGSSKIKQIMQQVRFGRTLGVLTYTAFLWAQQIIGTRTPLIEETDHTIYLKDPWLSSVHQWLLAWLQHLCKNQQNLHFTTATQKRKLHNGNRPKSRTME